MRRVPSLLASAVLAVTSATAAEFRVNDYGAKGDGKTLDTVAIQKALDAAAKARGSIVVFNRGTYLTGSIFVKSGTHLRIDKRVELRGIQDLAGYPDMQTRIAGIEMRWPAALVNVVEQKNVKITGKGVIDGDGEYWWNKYWTLRKEYEPKGLRWASDYDAKRPRLIQVYQSEGVTLQGLTLRRAGFWTVHLCYSRKITVDGLTIRNNIGGRGPSTDGIDVDSSSDVLIQRCDIEGNDDALCMKAGRDADGLRVNRPTERVEIRNCTIRGGAAGFTIGSETSGGIRNIRVSNLKVLKPVPSGIIFKSARTRGGTVENIAIDGMELDGVATPVDINLDWNPTYSYAKIPEGMTDVPDHWRVLTEHVPPEKGMPHFRNVRISKIRAVGATRAFAVSGYPESPLENFAFRDLTIEAKAAGTIDNVSHWDFRRLKLKTADGSVPAVRGAKDVTGLPEKAAAR